VGAYGKTEFKQEEQFNATETDMKRPQTYLFSSLFDTCEGSPLALDSNSCCLEVDIYSLIRMMQVLMSVCIRLRMKRCSHLLRTPRD